MFEEFELEDIYPVEDVNIFFELIEEPEIEPMAVEEESAYEIRMKAIKNKLIHEFLNVYSQLGIYLPYPEATWWGVHDNKVDITTEVEQAYKSEGNWIEDSIFKQFGVEPVVITYETPDGNIKDESKIYQARFEFPQYGKDFKYTKGKETNKTVGFIDFYGGLPFGCIETMGVIGEQSTDEDNLEVESGIVNGEQYPVAPVTTLFGGFNENQIIYNNIWIPEDNVYVLRGGDNSTTALSTDLDNQLKLWWTRFTFETDISTLWPVPGEFLGLGIKIFPNLPWGRQKTNPFIYSGYWMDTLFYTTGKIISIDESGDYPLYTVKRRGQTIIAKPTDFVEYKVGDIVTIIKNINSNRKSQTWEDKETFDDTTWFVAPLLFYLEE